MKDLSNIKVIKQILLENDFKFSKNLGQNFITDPSVCPKMAEACLISHQDGVIEIGPGIGALTECLAKRFKKVLSVEIDKRLIPILSKNLSSFSNIKIIQNDILKVDINRLIETELMECENISVCANLPYYITTDIIMYLLEKEFAIDSIVIMIQKEAAERICALPGTRASGAISVVVRYFGAPEILFNVKKSSFMPIPKVDSCVVRIKVSAENKKLISSKEIFLKLVHAAFSKRRKNLLNSLSSGLMISKEKTSEILNYANINSTLRAENLKFEDWTHLSNIAFEKLK